MVYYGEWDPGKAEWLRELIKEGVIAPGEVDERSILDVKAADLKGFTQWHLFSGVGIWSYSLRLAGWSDERPVLTLSCPCFAAGTLVLTDLGYRPIETLAVGDMVLTHLGRWRPVNAVMSRDGAPLVRVRAQGVPDIVTTAEHPFWTSSARRAGHDGHRQWSTPQWVQAASLGSPGTYVSQVLPKWGDDEHTEAFWFLVGRYLADGWRCLTESSHGSKCRIIICAAGAKIAPLAEAIQNAGFQASMHEEQTVTKFSICNRELYEFLSQFGDKSHGKRIPRVALELEPGKCRALVDGYLAGDGYREDARTNTGYRATTVSRALALGMALLAQRSHGVVASVRRSPRSARHVIQGREVNQRDTYIVMIPDRNRSGTVEGDYGWKLVRKVTEAGVGRVHNIGVAEDESYCADGAVVHNCQPFSAAGERRGVEDERHLWPVAFELIRELQPPVLFGEQVSSKDGIAWFDGVKADLNSAGYSVCGFDMPAAAFGAPHIRQRLYFTGVPNADGTVLHGVGGRRGSSAAHAGAADGDYQRPEVHALLLPLEDEEDAEWDDDCLAEGQLAPDESGDTGGLGISEGEGLERRIGELLGMEGGLRTVQAGVHGGLAHASAGRCEESGYAGIGGARDREEQPAGHGVPSGLAHAEHRRHEGRESREQDARRQAEALVGRGSADDGTDDRLADSRSQGLEERGSLPGDARSERAAAVGDRHPLGLGHSPIEGPLPGPLGRVCGGEEGGGPRHGEPQRPGDADGMGDPLGECLRDEGLQSADAAARGVQGEDREREWLRTDAGERGPVNGFWRGADWVLTRPQRLGDSPSLRPIKSSAQCVSNGNSGDLVPVRHPGFPLAQGEEARVLRLRGYGDAICASQAAFFVKAFMEELEEE